MKVGQEWGVLAPGGRSGKQEGHKALVSPLEFPARGQWAALKAKPSHFSPTELPNPFLQCHYNTLCSTMYNSSGTPCLTPLSICGKFHGYSLPSTLLDMVTKSQWQETWQFLQLFFVKLPPWKLLSLAWRRALWSSCWPLPCTDSFAPWQQRHSSQNSVTYPKLSFWAALEKMSPLQEQIEAKMRSLAILSVRAHTAVHWKVSYKDKNVPVP